MLKKELLDKFFYNHIRNYGCNRIYKNDNLFMYYLKCYDDRNEFYHYFTKIAEYNFYEDTLYLLDHNFLKDFPTTRKTLREISRKFLSVKTKSSQIFFLEPIRYNFYKAFFEDSQIKISKENENKYRNEKIYKIKFLFHFPKEDYLSPIRFQQLFLRNSTKFERIEAGCYNGFNGLIIKRYKNSWQIIDEENNYIIKTGIKTLNIAKRFAFFLITRINFLRLKREDGRYKRLNGQELSFDEKIIIEKSINEVRRNGF